MYFSMSAPFFKANKPFEAMQYCDFTTVFPLLIMHSNNPTVKSLPVMAYCFSKSLLL